MYIAYAQLPDAMLRVRNANAMILGYDMVLYAQYGLCVHTQPGHLEAGQIVDNAREQCVPSHGHRYIVDGPAKLGIRCKWTKNACELDNVRIALAFTSELIRVFNGASLKFTRRANATT